MFVTTHVRIKTWRILHILLILMLYGLLLERDAQLIFSPLAVHSSSLLLSSLRFGFSALIALLFLAVGSLVWLHARSRQVALLLLCFSSASMATFAVQTAAAANDPLLSAIGAVSSTCALASFAILLLLFPRNYLIRATAASGRRFWPMLALRGYTMAVVLLGAMAVVYAALRHLVPVSLPAWLGGLYFGYSLFVLTGILLTITVSYRRASSVRERQQQRIFMSGVVVAFVPLVVLTILPLALNLTRYVIDSQFSTLTVILLPLALGYSILRYQVLVFDASIRRVASWIMGILGLALLAYLIILLCGFVLGNAASPSANLILATIAMAVLGPVMWRSIFIVTERFFFNEIWQYRQLIERPDLLTHETLELEEASRLLTVAVVQTFETPAACLFVLDEETGRFQLVPALREDNPSDALRRTLVQQVVRTRKSPSDDEEGTDWLDGHDALVNRLAQASRPLLHSEACRTLEDAPTGLARYLTTEPVEGSDPLLTPVLAKDKMIGILAAGERGDEQSYAGPDFEAMHLLQARFSPVLETARLYAQATRHAAILNFFYSAAAQLGTAFQPLEELAMVAARVSAEALSAGAEVWLSDEGGYQLRRQVHIGSGPLLTQEDTSLLAHEGDWASYFHEQGSLFWGNDTNDIPPCLHLPDASTLDFPFAWLPLTRGERHLGVLALTFSRPHRFGQEERRVLEMFASQCAANIENAQMTLDLRAAYGRQKELDELKDQFIITASHELRTPLTAVQGYIELLAELGQDVPSELRAKFLATARLNCEELAEMVNTITDVGRVGFDIRQIKLREVSLATSITKCVEMLETQLRREHHALSINIPTSIHVMADDVSLRQVLLNLVSNACKYSSEGTPMDITCAVQDQQVTVRIRDHGKGVPPHQQEHLFERFVRLERDMNSPVRGAGLGLYISKQLVEAMGGRIWVESIGIEGQGSCFCFTLTTAEEDTEFIYEKQENNFQTLLA